MSHYDHASVKFHWKDGTEVAFVTGALDVIPRKGEYIHLPDADPEDRRLVVVAVERTYGRNGRIEARAQILVDEPAKQPEKWPTIGTEED